MGNRSLLGVAIRFGLFALLTGALTVYIGAEIAKIDRSDNYSLIATFDDVSGLWNGDDVKLAGVKVGQVSSIEVVDGRAEVAFTVREGVELPVDTTATIRWRNLIGQRYLYVYPGDATALLEDGDRVERTESVVDIGDLIDSLGPLAAAIDPAELNSLVTAFGEAVADDSSVDQLVSDLGSLVETLASRDDTIAQMIEDYDRVTAAVASRDDQIRTMVDNLVLLTETFAANEQVLDRALVELADFSTALDSVLTANADELSTIVGGLSVITETAVGRLTELERTLGNLPGATKALFDTTNRGEYVVVKVLCFAVDAPPCPTPVVPQGAGARVPASIDAPTHGWDWMLGAPVGER